MPVMNVIRLSKLNTYTVAHSLTHRRAQCQTYTHTIYSGSIADGWHCTAYETLNNTCSQRFSLSFHLYRSLCVLLMSLAYTYTQTSVYVNAYTHCVRWHDALQRRAHFSKTSCEVHARTAQPQPLTRLRLSLAVKPNRFQ